MEKIHPILKERYSTVTFYSQEVEKEKLNLLFDAARWAPSGYNGQPWRFIVGEKGKDENYQKLFDSMVDANKYWAKHAPVLVLGLALKVSEHNGKPNRFAEYETGMAVGNLLAQATSLGLYIHQMGGYSVEKIKESFNLNENLQPLALMAIGYKADLSGFADDLKERELKPRTRKAVEDILL